MEEIWKPIEGFEMYEVSNLGRVRSLHRNKVRIMPQTKQHHGYHAVMFSINNKSYCRKVHRLVAQHFIPNPNHLNEVNHIDGNKDNNQVSNLEWVTHQYNVQHSFDTGLKSVPPMTEEQKEHLRSLLKGVPKSPETRQKMSEAQKGKPKPKCSVALKGRKLSPETRRKLSDAHKGLKHSPETIEKLKNAWVKRRDLSNSQPPPPI